jgi:hypothetical protein
LTFQRVWILPLAVPFLFPIVKDDICLIKWVLKITLKFEWFFHPSIRCSRYLEIRPQGLVRDRPFNLQGGLWFRKKILDNTRVRILFFLSCKAQIFFPEFNIRLYDKNSESEYFFFLHPNQNIFFSNIGNLNIFLEKNHTPPRS